MKKPKEYTLEELKKLADSISKNPSDPMSNQKLYDNDKELADLLKKNKKIEQVYGTKAESSDPEIGKLIYSLAEGASTPLDVLKALSELSDVIDVNSADQIKLLFRKKMLEKERNKKLGRDPYAL